MNKHGGQSNTKKLFDLEDAKNFILSLHQEFDSGRGDEGKSFHNQHHIETVLKAAVSLVEEVIRGDDPLRLEEQLDQWNKKNPKAKVNGMEELLEVVQYAFLWHDLGNICKDIEVKNGKIKAIYLPDKKYQAQGAEERSKVMAKKLSTVFIKDKGKRKRYLPLILHLIEQTKFTSELQNKLFNQFVQVVDQIGNVVFIKPELRIKQVVGLLSEMISENPDATYIPDVPFNFYYKRFPILVADKNIREQILKIWQANDGTIPDKIEGLSPDEVVIDLNKLPPEIVSELNKNN